MLRYADIFAWTMTFMEHLLLKRFRYIAYKYNKKDPIYDTFYNSKETTLKNLKFNLDFLDVDADPDSMFSLMMKNFFGILNPIYK